MNLLSTRLTTVLLVVAVAVGAAAVGTIAVSHSSDSSNPQAVSYLRVAHLSPDAPAVDVYLDNESVVTNASFGDVTDYLHLSPGEHTILITAAGDREAVVLNETATVEPRTVLTVAAAGELAADGNSTFGLRFYSDNAVAPASNSSALRIAHLSPDAGAVTLTANNGSTVLAENLSDGETADYLTVPPGNYTVELRQADGNGTGTLLETVEVSLEGGQAYTAWAIGYVVPLTGQQPFAVATTEDAMTSLTFPATEAANETVTSPTSTSTAAPPTGTETDTSPTATPPTGTETNTSTTETQTATES